MTSLFLLLSVIIPTYILVLVYSRMRDARAELYILVAIISILRGVFVLPTKVIRTGFN